MTNDETQRKRILLGMHDSTVEHMMKKACSGQGYDCVVKLTSEEFLAELKNPFNRYITEANLGVSNGEDLTPARVAYSTLVAKLGKEKADREFIAITGNGKYVQILNDEGIPVEYKPLFFAKLKAFLSD